VEIDIARERVPDGVSVRVRVRLSGRETSRLFVSGDTLVDLPLQGAVQPGAGAAGPPIPRTAIFLSELAALPEGFTRVFAGEAAADAFSAAVEAGIRSALPAP
jgi:hypothetical protein